MRSEYEIEYLIKHYEDDLKLLKQNYKLNKDEELNWLHSHQIGLTEGVIKGLKIALGHKTKLELKSKYN